MISRLFDLVELAIAVVFLFLLIKHGAGCVRILDHWCSAWDHVGREVHYHIH
jgi:hypothetical protein